MRSLFKIIYLGALTAVLSIVLAGCAQPQSEPVVVTIVQTVPVEVLVTVEVPVITEVTREVVMTQLVEVVVTPLPTATLAEPTSTPTATFAPQMVNSTPIPALTYVPLQPVAPDEKGGGFAPLKVINNSNKPIEVYVNGNYYYVFKVEPRQFLIQLVPEGEYSYQIFRAGEFDRDGTFSITNIDKHELVISNDSTRFVIP